MMKYNWFETASPFVKFLLTLFIMMGCMLTAFIFAAIVAIPFTHMNIESIISAISDIHNPKSLNLIKYFQVVQSFSFFLFPAFLVPFLFGHKPLDYLKLRKYPVFIISVISILLIISIIPLINYLQELNSHMQFPGVLKGMENWMKNSEKAANDLSEQFLKVNNIGGLLFNLFMMAILPALSEEFLFRGVFQRIFSEMFRNYHLGILFSAALFSAIHFQFYGFVPRMLLGVVFGYMLVWSGTLWIPVIAHFFNNALGIIFYFFLNKGTVDNSLNTIGTGKKELQIALISLIFSLLLLYLFYYLSRKKERGISI
jgi:uncharacterized protein